MKVLLTIVICCTLSQLSSAVSLRPKNPLLGQGQIETVELWNKILEGTFSTYSGTNSYNSKFRPPSLSDNGIQGPDPTIVDFSLRDIRITKYNETEGKLYFNSELIREFTDSRLSFDPPYKGFTFTPIPEYTDIWKPEFRVLDAEEFHQRYDSYGEEEQSFLNPDGRVYHKQPIEVNLKDKDNRRVFTFKILGKKFTVEDMQFRWNEDTPLTLRDQSVKTDFATYSILPAVDQCRQEEEFGSFIGQREFGCIQFTIKLIPTRY